MRLQLIPIILAVIINAAIDVYIYKKLKDTGKPRWMQNAHLGLSVLLLVYIIVAVALPRRTIDNDGLRLIMWMLFSYFTVYIPKYFALIVAGICSIPKLFKRKSFRHTPPVACTAGIMLFIVMWWGALVTRSQYDVKEVTLEFQNLPYQFDGYRIAQISDIHLGTYGSDTTFISKIVDTINGLKPNLICFTGDIVNRQTDEAYPFKSVLSRLHADDGVLSILGNHDYGDYRKWDNPAQREANNRDLAVFEKDLGWNLMNNTDTLITRGENHICIIGVENWGEPPFPKYGKLTQAHHNLNDGTFKILLSHNPNHWRGEVLPKSNIDLMLAGHTHAMQMELDLFGLRLSPSKFRYNEWGGIYEENGQKLYVNIGIGEVALPMRIGATPEITIITLKKKQ